MNETSNLVVNPEHRESLNGDDYLDELAYYRSC